jgi:hypothetical protein
LHGPLVIEVDGVIHPEHLQLVQGVRVEGFECRLCDLARTVSPCGHEQFIRWCTAAFGRILKTSKTARLLKPNVYVIKNQLTAKLVVLQLTVFDGGVIFVVFHLLVVVVCCGVVFRDPLVVEPVNVVAEPVNVVEATMVVDVVPDDVVVGVVVVVLSGPLDTNFLYFIYW